MSTVQLKKYAHDGATAGEVEVSEQVFGIEPNRHVLNLAVRRELAHARSGTACTKTRSEVRGGGRKPWKQKGTGRARAGSIRSPLWVGGGVIFGPKPRKFTVGLPKKVRRLAVRSSLSAARDKFVVLPDFSFLTESKTRHMATLLKKLGLADKKVLILYDYQTEGANMHLKLASRNLRGVTLRLPSNLSVRDLLDVDAVIIDEASLKTIDERYMSYAAL